MTENPAVVMLPRFEVVTAEGRKPVRYPLVLHVAAPGLVVHLALEEDAWQVSHWHSGRRLAVDLSGLEEACEFALTAATWCDFTKPEAKLRGHAQTIRTRIRQWERRHQQRAAA